MHDAFAVVVLAIALEGMEQEVVGGAQLSCGAQCQGFPDQGIEGFERGAIGVFLAQLTVEAYGVTERARKP
jgi:hypothetical protein